MKQTQAFQFINFNRSRVITALLISLSTALIFGLINPLDLFWCNRAELFVSLTEVLQCLLFPMCMVFFAVLLLLLIALWIHRYAFDILKAGLLGFTFASYCQELFLNGKMIIAENNSTVGEISDIEVSLNLLLHFAIIAAFVLVTASRTIYSKKTENTETNSEGQNSPNFLSRNIVPYLFLCIAVMKMTGLASSYAKTANAQKSDTDLPVVQSSFFSYEPTVSFAKEHNNICVFVMDMFDSMWCDELLELYPELCEELEGFTFYQNNTSSCENTFPSVCSMLTHQEVYDSDKMDYLAQAWAGDSTLSVLKEHGYRINLVLDASTTYGDTQRIQPFCDNLVPLEDMGRTVKKPVLQRILYHLSFNRFLPYALKSCVPNALPAIKDAEYLEFTAEEPEKITMNIVSESTDIHLYDYVSTAEFNTDCNQDVFSIFHLNCAHDINLPFAEKTGADKGTDMQKTIRANLEIILHYIRNAKELGVYDNTTFIIVADHGRRIKEIRDENDNLAAPILPALMVKPANAAHSPLQYDAVTGLSNDMFMASVLEYAGIAHQSYGVSYQDVIQSKQVIPRSFLWARCDTQYVITGDARDFSNWEKIN